MRELAQLSVPALSLGKESTGRRIAVFPATSSDRVPALTPRARNAGKRQLLAVAKGLARHAERLWIEALSAEMSAAVHARQKSFMTIRRGSSEERFGVRDRDRRCIGQGRRDGGCAELGWRRGQGYRAGLRHTEGRNERRSDCGRDSR